MAKQTQTFLSEVQAMQIMARTAFLALCAALIFAGPATAAPITQTTIAQGALKGVADGAVAKFFGIPYAAPPVGENRWREPQPAASWNGERDASAFGPVCMQRLTPDGFGPWTKEYITQGPASEDCLTVNVWTPATSKNAHLPVLFWIYGGGFNSGSGKVPIYDGANLAKRGIIVVTFNFRVGVFGFLAHPELTAESPHHASGNYGMLDIIAALKWVRANIAAFGGDPNAITLAGQSSGSGAVNYLDVSPLARGLYARAIMESGVRIGRGGPGLKEAEDKGREFVTATGAISIQALRALPADRLLTAARGLPGGRFASIFDGYVLPEAPIDMIKKGQFNKATPILTGFTAEEQTGNNAKADKMTLAECTAYIGGAAASAEAFRQTYLAQPNANCYEDIRILARDRNVTTSYDWALIRLVQGSAPVYTYLFNHTEPGAKSNLYRAFHTVEVPYVFDNLDKSPERPFTPADHDIADKAASYWVNFVKTGNPNGAGLPDWPAVSAARPETMELGDRFGGRPVASSEERIRLVKAYLDSEDGIKTVFEGALPF